MCIFILRKRKNQPLRLTLNISLNNHILTSPNWQRRWTACPGPHSFLAAFLSCYVIQCVKLQIRGRSIWYPEGLLVKTKWNTPTLTAVHLSYQQEFCWYLSWFIPALTPRCWVQAQDETIHCKGWNLFCREWCYGYIKITPHSPA